MGYEAKMLQEHQLLLSMQQKTQRAAEQEEHKERLWRLTYIMGVPTLLLPLPLYMNSKAGWCIYCMVWMAMYWATETISLPATALLPLVMFPLVGIFSTGETTALYFNVDHTFEIVCFNVKEVLEKDVFECGQEMLLIGRSWLLRTCEPKQAPNQDLFRLVEGCHLWKALKNAYAPPYRFRRGKL
ncbi:hypothetical protein HPB51_003343 [Rhipicephalus microplus]|uniref:Uncharacterized protein n=1 Tax=Rhipicephalus microplus TaxID=6941 RepID=A0A9J6EY12_RHIMP|nr:hypothetical protein HPB51_003343 [Rhipicephalus microplus]